MNPKYADSPVYVVRRTVGMSRRELAVRSGLNVNTIERLERGSQHPARGESATIPRRATMEAVAAALDCPIADLFPSVAVDPARIGLGVSWPPDELVSDTYLAVRAYRAAGDSIGAGELLGVTQDTVRKRLNAAGCLPRPRGGDRADGVMALAGWARAQQVTVLDALADLAKGRVPGAFVEPLADPVLRCRHAVRA